MHTLGGLVWIGRDAAAALPFPSRKSASALGVFVPRPSVAGFGRTTGEVSQFAEGNPLAACGVFHPGIQKIGYRGWRASLERMTDLAHEQEKKSQPATRQATRRARIASSHLCQMAPAGSGRGYLGNNSALGKSEAERSSFGSLQAITIEIWPDAMTRNPRQLLNFDHPFGRHSGPGM